MADKKVKPDVNKGYGFDYDQKEDSEKRKEDIYTIGEPATPIPNFDVFSTGEVRKYAWYQIEESSLALLANLEPCLREKYLKCGHLPGPRRYELGRFHLNQNHFVVFEAIPALHKVYYTEIQDFSQDQDLPSDSEVKVSKASPILRFLELSDKNDPVPEMLIELDDSSANDEVVKLLRTRDIVDSLDAVGGIQAGFDLVPASGTSAAALWTCFGGGHAAFRDGYCSSPNSPWGLDYCDNGMWTHLIRTSGSHRMRNSFTKVASCFGITNVFHYYRMWWGGWKWFIASNPGEPAQQLIQPSEVRFKEIYDWKRHRRKVEIRVATGLPTSYFRAWTSFFF